MNLYGWNLNPMASYPYEQPRSVRRWNVPSYDDQFSHRHVAGRFFENGTIFQTRQFPSDEVEVEEVIAQESRTQSQAQTTGSGTKEKKRKRKGKPWQVDKRGAKFTSWSLGWKHDRLEVRTQGKFGLKSATRLKWTSAPKRQPKNASERSSIWLTNIKTQSYGTRVRRKVTYVKVFSTTK